MAKQKIAPRLFVIFAKDAHEAVIFRRGPSAWYHVIRWDTKNDKFYPGAWIKGRIYPERCDLSPNGELLLYFVHQGRKLGTDYTDAWNAISRSPWLDALGLWPQGSTWGGGGRFTNDQSAILRHHPIEAHPKHPGTGLNISFATRSTPVPHHVSTQEVKDAEWSGRDQRGRLFYTFDGKLMCAGNKKTDPIFLADFNDCTPNPQPAPASARQPLAIRNLKSKPSQKKPNKKK